MITYVYNCSACSETFELKQRITDEPITQCHLCNSEEPTLSKVLQGQRPQFLNEGWGDMERKGHMHPSSLEKKRQNLGEV